MAERFDVEALEDIEHLERDHTLRVRWQLEHLVAAIGRRDGRDPVGAIRRQVGGRQQAATRLHVGRDRLCDRPAVERVAPAAPNRLERLGQIRVLEDFAGDGRPAAKKKRRRGRGILRQGLLLGLPLSGDDLADGEPLAGVADGGLDGARERDRAVLRQELLPSVDDAGHAHRERAAIRDLVELAAAELVGRRRGGGAAARVQAAHGLRLCVVDDREEVPANTVHRRLDDRENRGGGDGGVDGVAALLEHAQAGRRGERLAGGDDPVAREHHRPRRPRVGRGPVARQLPFRHHDTQRDHGHRQRFYHRGSLPSCLPASRAGDHFIAASLGKSTLPTMSRRTLMSSTLRPSTVRI